MRERFFGLKVKIANFRKVIAEYRKINIAYLCFAKKFNPTWN